MRVQSLGQEDPLEKGMANSLQYSYWKTPWAEELQFMGLPRVGHDLVTKEQTSLGVHRCTYKFLEGVQAGVWNNQTMRECGTAAGYSLYLKSQ